MNETVNACCQSERGYQGVIGQTREGPVPIQSEDKIYDIHIHQVDRGYTVQVGCKTFAFEEKDRLLAYLTDYIKNPEDVLKKYYDGSLFFPPTA